MAEREKVFSQLFSQLYYWLNIRWWIVTYKPNKLFPLQVTFGQCFVRTTEKELKLVALVFLGLFLLAVFIAQGLDDFRRGKRNFLMFVILYSFSELWNKGWYILGSFLPIHMSCYLKEEEDVGGGRGREWIWDRERAMEEEKVLSTWDLIPLLGILNLCLEKIFFSFGPKLLLDFAFWDSSCGFQHC